MTAHNFHIENLQPLAPRRMCHLFKRGCIAPGKYIYLASGYSVWRYEESRSNAPAPPHLVPISRTFWFDCIHRYTSRCASLMICASATCHWPYRNSRKNIDGVGRGNGKINCLLDHNDSRHCVWRVLEDWRISKRYDRFWLAALFLPSSVLANGKIRLDQNTPEQAMIL